MRTVGDREVDSTLSASVCRPEKGDVMQTALSMVYILGSSSIRTSVLVSFSLLQSLGRRDRHSVESKGRSGVGLSVPDRGSVPSTGRP